jgi:hypothetical protein
LLVTSERYWGLEQVKPLVESIRVTAPLPCSIRVSGLLWTVDVIAHQKGGFWCCESIWPIRVVLSTASSRDEVKADLAKGIPVIANSPASYLVQHLINAGCAEHVSETKCAEPANNGTSQTRA